MNSSLRALPRGKGLLIAGGVAIGALAGGAFAFAQQDPEPPQASGQHVPDQPGVLREVVQPPKAPPSAVASVESSPTVVSAPTISAGRLVAIAARAAPTDWVGAEQPDFPLRLRMPGAFQAIFTEHPTLDGSGSTFDLTVANVDLKAGASRPEGSWPSDGRTWVSITLYASGGPVFIARPEALVIDSAELGTRIPRARPHAQHLKRTDGAPDAVVVHELIRLSDGRGLLIFAGTLRPDDDASVAELLSIVQSIEVK